MDDGPEELTHGLGHSLVQPGEDEEGQLRHQQAPVTVILRNTPCCWSVVNLKQERHVIPRLYMSCKILHLPCHGGAGTG